MTGYWRNLKTSSFCFDDLNPCKFFFNKKGSHFSFHYFKEYFLLKLSSSFKHGARSSTNTKVFTLTFISTDSKIVYKIIARKCARSNSICVFSKVNVLFYSIFILTAMEFQINNVVVIFYSSTELFFWHFSISKQNW